MSKLINAIFVLVLILNSPTFPQDILTAHKQRAEEAAYKEQLARNIIAANQAQTANQEKFDVKSYDLNLIPNPQTEVLSGDVLIRAMVVGEPLDFVELNFLQNMIVDSVLAGGSLTTFTHQENILRCNLDRAYTIGEAFTLQVIYHGRPQQSGFGAFDFSSYSNQPMIWTLSEPFGARNWWPCKDIPADKADSVDIRVTVPANLVVASNGSLREVTEQNGQKTYWWHEGFPIVTYLVSMAIYPYQVFSDWYVYGDNDSMEVQFFVFPDHYDRLKNNYAKTVDMIAAYSDLFGQYPFIDEKYGHAEFLWGGGMEHQTITSLGGWGESLIAHELAHQWWGDMITCDSFHHIWLNEGFATYCEALWNEYTYGSEFLHRSMQFEEYLGPGTVYVEDPETDNIFDGRLSYSKGAWVLHMLRHVVGDSNFFTILQTYYDRFKFKTATTEQFRDVCEQVSGMDLQVFFQQWIYQSGHPVYTYAWNWQHNSSNEYQVIGAIAQTQTDAPLFAMPVDITVKTASAETTFVVWVKNQSAQFACTLDAQPVEVLLDKDNWILKEVVQVTSPLISYVGVTTEDLDGNIDGHVDPGESADLVIQLANLGQGSNGIVATLSTEDPSILVVDGNADFGDIPSGGVADNQIDPFRIFVSSETKGHTAKFSLSIASAGGYRNYVEFSLEIGTSRILFVDDDNGKRYEDFIVSMAQKADIQFDLWNDETQSPPPDTLKTYDMLVWFTGDDRETSLTFDEQRLIAGFIDRGGRVCISGQNIGYDLIGDGSSADSFFYAQYLKAEFIADVAGKDRVLGIGGDPITAGLSVFFNGDYPAAGNQTSPDIIAPIEPAVQIFRYLPGLETAAIRYENQDSKSRVVYFAFGLEGISGSKAETAATLLSKTLIWLAGGVTQTNVQTEGITTPSEFYLSQNYPNPFSSKESVASHKINGTKIDFSLPTQAQVVVTVYNTRGQLVKVLYDGELRSGWHTLAWNGRDVAGVEVASGIYLLTVRVTSDNHSEIIRTLKVAKLR